MSEKQYTVFDLPKDTPEPTWEEIQKMPFLFCIMVRAFYKGIHDTEHLVIGIYNNADPNLWDAYLFASFIINHLNPETVADLQMVDLNIYVNEHENANLIIIPSWLMATNRVYFDNSKMILPTDSSFALVKNNQGEFGAIRRYSVFFENVPHHTVNSINILQGAKEAFLEAIAKNPTSHYESCVIYVMNEYLIVIGFYIYSKTRADFEYIKNSHIEKLPITRKLDGLVNAIRVTPFGRSLDRLLVLYCMIVFNIGGGIYPFYLASKYGISEVAVMYANGELVRRWGKIVSRDFKHFFLLSTILYVSILYLLLR